MIPVKDKICIGDISGRCCILEYIKDSKDFLIKNYAQLKQFVKLMVQ